jgi:hypothetical protein
MRDLALEILGQFVHAAGAQLPAEFLGNVAHFAVAAVQKGSAAGACVVGQLAAGAPAALAHPGALLELLLAKMGGKRADPGFVDNAVAAIAEIQRHVMREGFPVEPFLLPCLAAMPAREDESVNPDLFRFFVWLAGKRGVEPAQAFVVPAVKLLSLPTEKLVDMDELLPQVAEIMAIALRKIEEAEAVVTELCDNDPYRIERVRRWAVSYQA